MCINCHRSFAYGRFFCALLAKWMNSNDLKMCGIQLNSFEFFWWIILIFKKCGWIELIWIIWIIMLLVVDTLMIVDGNNGKYSIVLLFESKSLLCVDQLWTLIMLSCLPFDPLGEIQSSSKDLWVRVCLIWPKHNNSWRRLTSST
jgi:hypothetical protein